MSGSAGIVLGTNGINPDKKASVSESFSLTEQGRYVQIRVTNTTGRITIRSIGIQANPGTRSLGTKVSTP